MVTINLYQMFETDTLCYRDNARKVVKKLPRDPKSPVMIDFAKIDFASRSFLHELLYNLSNREVAFENRTEFIEKLMEIIERKRACITC